MSQEVCTDAVFRLVRDSDAGHYFVQVGFGDHFRSFSALKLGKMDVFRDQAKQEALKTQVPAADSQE